MPLSLALVSPPLPCQDAGCVRHAAVSPGSAKEEPGDAGETAGFKRVDGAYDREGHHHHGDGGNDTGMQSILDCTMSFISS